MVYTGAETLSHLKPRKTSTAFASTHGHPAQFVGKTVRNNSLKENGRHSIDVDAEASGFARGSPPCRIAFR
jgi:hypothetical protein